MTTHSTSTVTLDPEALYAPTGARIVGTAEELLATAHVTSVTRAPGGELSFDYAGDSKIHWETQEPRRNARGEVLWTDETGRDWPQSCLSLGNEPLRPAPADDPAESLHRMTDREASATIEALRYLQRDMMADGAATSELSLEEIDALCERLNLDGHSPDANAEDSLRVLVAALRDLKVFGGAGGTDAEEAAAAALEKAEKFLA